MEMGYSLKGQPLARRNSIANHRQVMPISIRGESAAATVALCQGEAPLRPAVEALALYQVNRRRATKTLARLRQSAPLAANTLARLGTELSAAIGA